MGVIGQSLPPKNDFEHARGLRNSSYAVNLTYETYRHTISYFTSKSGIWLVISRVASYFHEPEASANTAYE